ncbi:MAG TPA: hypothetical protein VJU81_03420 [Methylomirabilota bacterium]|nr:hypothetical protein [Methylomirabilota bacterium]
MTEVGPALLAASQARDLCLSLRRAFRGPPAVARLRAGTAAALDHDDLVLALGLVWASGDITLVRRALDEVDPIRVAADPRLLAFRDAVNGDRLD